MEWIKSILAGTVADDKIDEVIAKVNAEFPKHAVPKDKYNEVSAQNKALSDKNKEYDDLVAGLKGKAESADAREQEIAKLKADVEGTKQKYEQQIADLGKRSALKDLLVKGKAHPDAHSICWLNHSVPRSNLTTKAVSRKPINSLKRSKPKRAVCSLR